MIIRISVKCTICNSKYLIRFNIGNKFPQSSMFYCKKCGEKLTFGLDIDKNYIYINLENIIESKISQIINLHPELPINSVQETDPYYFPSIDFLSNQIKKGTAGHLEMRKAQSSIIRYKKEWLLIHQDYRYLIEQRWHMLEPKYGENQLKIEKTIIKNVIDSTQLYLEGKWWNEIYKNVLVETEKTKKHNEFKYLKSFLMEFKSDFLLQKMNSIMTQYFEVEAELLPTLLSQKCSQSIEGKSSSPDWKKIEKIYGDFYEIYGDLLVIPTIINNLLIRDDFKKFEFENFTIDKYLDTDKAGRIKNFISNPKLYELSKFYDSTIRNSTHHQATKYEIDNQTIAMKTGKGGKKIKNLALLDYVIHCNEIYARCLILFKTMYKLIY